MNTEVLNILKVWYKDEVENLLFRNSPVFSKIGKERVEGKSQNFPALAGFAGGVGGNYYKAVQSAGHMGKVAQYAVVPGQVFGAVQFDNKEVLASKTNKGAFAKVADTKLFTTFDMVKKILAAAMYGRGYGELCYSNYSTAIASGVAFDITVPEYATMSILQGMSLELKSSLAASTALTKLKVNSVNDTSINVTADTAVATPATTDIICIADSIGSAGEALLPMGLAGWLPQVAARTGANWNTFVARDFFGVNRAANQSALCGAYVDSTATNEAKTATIQKLLRKVRRQGSKADFMVMNDEDRIALNDEIANSTRYIAETKVSAAKGAKVGVGSVSAVFSSSEIPEIYEDPFCPKGRFYILDSDCVKFWSYSNAEKALDTGIAGNEPGTAEANADYGVENKPYAMLIDDILSLQPGTAGQDGPTTVIGINVYGSFVVTNTAHCGVGNFYGATDIQRESIA